MVSVRSPDAPMSSRTLMRCILASFSVYGSSTRWISASGPMPLISLMAMKSLILSPLCSRWKHEYCRAAGSSMMDCRTSWTCSWGETYGTGIQRLRTPRA